MGNKAKKTKLTNMVEKKEKRGRIENKVKQMYIRFMYIKEQIKQEKKIKKTKEKNINFFYFKKLE